MAVRPFYCKAVVAGRKTDVSFGPRVGGMNVSFLMKDTDYPGSIRGAFTVSCFTRELLHEGKLQVCHCVEVIDSESGEIVASKISPKG